MKNKFSVRWSTIAISLILLTTLSSGWVYAQAASGPMTANTCAGAECISLANTPDLATMSHRGHFNFWHLVRFILNFSGWYPAPTPTIPETPTNTPEVTVTTIPTDTATITPQPGQVNLVMNGPVSASAGQTFNVAVVAQHVPDLGLYGTQFEVHFNPALVSISNLQPNAAFTYILYNNADNDTGVIKFVASRQGDVPGLTGDVTLLTFDVTAGTGVSGFATFDFAAAKIGDPQAGAFSLTSQNYIVCIANGTITPTPETPTATPETPTATPETPTVTPETPTTTPETPTVTTTPETPTVTPETPTVTPETPTVTPETPTATPETPTVTPETPTTTPETPTTTPETPTVTTTPETPTVTPETPTVTPETPTPTPETPTPTTEPTTAIVSGQVGLQGRASDNWSGAAVTVDDSGQIGTTDDTGNFSIADVATGEHTSITADATGFLPAVCTAPSIVAPETVLANATLLSGDLNDDDAIDIIDATTVGVSFGSSGADLPADLNQDGVVDILDIILVSVNFGQSSQAWSCLP